MKRNIIFCIFALLLISGLFFFIIKYFESNNDIFIENKLISCENLREDACLENNNCRANYGPSQPMTADILFKSCTTLSEEEINQIHLDKSVCDNIGGKWFDGRYRHPGSCECPSPLILEDGKCQIK